MQHVAGWCVGAEETPVSGPSPGSYHHRCFSQSNVGIFPEVPSDGQVGCLVGPAPIQSCPRTAAVPPAASVDIRAVVVTAVSVFGAEGSAAVAACEAIACKTHKHTHTCWMC